MQPGKSEKKIKKLQKYLDDTHSVETKEKLSSKQFEQQKLREHQMKGMLTRSNKPKSELGRPRRKKL